MGMRQVTRKPLGSYSGASAGVSDDEWDLSPHLPPSAANAAEPRAAFDRCRGPRCSQAVPGPLA